MLFALLRSILTPSQPAAQSPDCSHDNDTVEQTLAHAKAGYKNAQEVIKFVDTKAAVITGLSTVTAGFLLATLKWSIESHGVSRPRLYQVTATHTCAAVFFYVFVVLSLLSLLVCLAAAVWSVIARSRPRNLENAFTILFPIYRRRDATQACRTFERKLKGMSKSDILTEYEDQLRIVGMILGKKLKHIRISCIAILVQMTSLSIALGLLTYMYVTYPVKSPPCPDSRDIAMAVFSTPLFACCISCESTFLSAVFPHPVPRQRARRSRQPLRIRRSLSNFHGGEILRRVCRWFSQGHQQFCSYQNRDVVILHAKQNSYVS